MQWCVYYPSECWCFSTGMCCPVDTDAADFFLCGVSSKRRNFIAFPQCCSRKPHLVAASSEADSIFSVRREEPEQRAWGHGEETEEWTMSTSAGQFQQGLHLHAVFFITALVIFRYQILLKYPQISISNCSCYCSYFLRNSSCILTLSRLLRWFWVLLLFSFSKQCIAARKI